MCGIVAMFSTTGQIREEALRSASRALEHRGPDGQGHWVSPSRRVGLGHTRLSIIDLRTGEQPLANEDDAVHAVVNGEFYDYARIRGGLEQRGHRFKTRTDSEILLHLYEDLGASAVHQLRGEFAFTLWDDAAQVLFAARDRFGIKPLFYAHHEGTLYLASEIKALLAAGVPARWDHEAFYQSTKLFVCNQDRTLFAGIRQVPPGHYLWVTRDHLQVVRYWDFDYPRSEDIQAQPREYAAEFAEILDEAVRLRMRADVPVGCYLSGGIDSCAALGLAMRHTSAPIAAFTLGFDHEDYDERPIAQEMAAHAGADYYPILVDHDMFADNFLDALWHAETPFINGHGIAKYMLSRAVRAAGYKVVLTGEGSDEILAGYPHFRRDALLLAQRQTGAVDTAQRLSDLSAKNKVLNTMGAADAPQAVVAGVARVLGYVPSWLEAFAAGGVSRAPLLADGFTAEFRGYDAYQGFLAGLDVRGQLTGRDEVNQSMYTLSKLMLPNYILTVLGDRMEMAHSVEGRVPFLDHHVVEAAVRLPISQKIHGTTEKYVLREAARSVLTDKVYRRQKHPFVAPPSLFNLDGRLHELLQDTLRGPDLPAQPFYDPARVLGLLDRIPAMDMATRGALDVGFMLILSTCLLQKRFGLGV